ncbi:hypothetical protein C8263_15395 [Deinococcus arcticus]|uniref:Uncharacterized protein n=1 Tax=Deinococcus arcticus TaxID=2136176 RepID=A0A2T3W4Y1_9DEIO|nr:hypothetical protein C8263_15395 [Deinococcus arcticus]
MAAHLPHHLLPITHPANSFAKPYEDLKWESNSATKAPPLVPAAPTPTDNEEVPVLTRRQNGRNAVFTVRALLMLDELHRFGFEQLRFESYGGHGFIHIFAARDEVSTECLDARFTPAVRRFSTLQDYEDLPVGGHARAQAWAQLLHGTVKPNHLAGLFLLDYADVARSGFGADEPYRHWFRGLRPFLHSGLLPITHAHFSHAQPLRELSWESLGAVPSFSGPPPNPYLTDPTA